MRDLICVFSDPKEIRKYKTVEEFYIRKINESIQFSSFDKPSKTSAVKVCSATPYGDQEVVSDHHIKVGDSAYPLDPLSAQGV